jgi:hypothetical protein
MSHRWTAACALALGGVLLAAVGCWGTGAKRMPQSKFSPTAGADAIKLYDTNNDGKISGPELDKASALKAAIAQIDSRHTGEITADMIDARVGEWVKTKLARMTVSCTVQRNGRPLGDVTVTFVPEKYLGPNVLQATGKTDKHGIAMLSIPTTGPRDPPGVGPGFYRVVVTSDKMKIPEQYSTEAKTTLGQEVAQDAEGIKNMKGIKFNLKF